MLDFLANAIKLKKHTKILGKEVKIFSDDVFFLENAREWNDN